LIWNGNTRQDAAPKGEAFPEARRDRVPAATDESKLHGRGFDLKFE
jgi:hypothetical protein